jgi:hypothetical protein
MLTMKPVMASSAAARATASSACRGTADTGSFSRLSARADAVVIEDPAGSRPASPGGARPPAVASHHCDG